MQIKQKIVYYWIFTGVTIYALSYAARLYSVNAGLNAELKLLQATLLSSKEREELGRRDAAYLHDCISSLSNNLAEAESSLATEKDSNMPLRSMVSALSAERIAQAARETDLLNKLKNGNAAVVTLQQELDESKKEAEKAARERDASAYLLSEMDDVAAERDSLLKNVSELKESVANSAKEIAGLNSEIEAIKTERDARAAEVKKALEEIAAMRSRETEPQIVTK